MVEEGISTSWHSYPSAKALGHGMIKEILFDPVIVEEKIDGSQFSFGRFGGELKCRSKGAQLNLFAPEKMFAAGIAVVNGLDLRDGWTYRAEYLQKPKHNVLAYDRIPKNHIILFDINPAHEQYLSWEEKNAEAVRLGIECVPLLYSGMIEDPAIVRELLDRVSVLGGQKLEGVVVKNYKRFTMDGKVQMGKFVSEAFKEVHNTSWKEENPGQKDIIERLIHEYRTPARWSKAVQHLREEGKITDEPKDIGLLFKEVGSDVRRECEVEIKQKLFDWAWANISRGITAGMPQWYKEELLKKQFNDVAA